MKSREAQTAASALGRIVVCLNCLLLICCYASTPLPALAQSSASELTPLQSAIEKERLRLGFTDVEERRDAVVRLGAMNRPESSRVASAGLHDSSAIVRATAARALLALPPEEAAALLIPQLQDRDEFVRQETAYALGLAQSRTSVAALSRLLEREKKDSVRGAVAVALGQIGDEAAVVTLSELLGRRVAASGIINRVRRKKKDENEFVRRAAAHSLGQIGSRAALPSLIAALLDERAPDDVRREAAHSLGLIGGSDAVAALRTALSARDPYLSRLAYEALLKIAPTQAQQPASATTGR